MVTVNVHVQGHTTHAVVTSVYTYVPLPCPAALSGGLVFRPLILSTL